VEKKDGCGIFFKDDRFKLVTEKSINFKDQHDRVALMVLLEDRNGCSRAAAGSHAQERSQVAPGGGADEDEDTEVKRDLVLVTTTHLYWDSTKVEDQMKELREGIHLSIVAGITTSSECARVHVNACADSRGEVGEGIEEMRSMVERKYNQSRLPIFFCGDFNNSPQSPIYRYMRDEIGVPIGPRSNTRMRSAYGVYGLLQPDQGQILLPEPGADRGAGEAGGLGEPTHTTVTSRRCWTIDYIWYTPSYLRPTHLLEVPEVPLPHARHAGSWW
jgi:hypothetical protein